MTDKKTTNGKTFFQHSISLTERAEKMVEEIMVEEPYGTLSEVCRAGIALLHKDISRKEFYRGKGANKVSPEDRAMENKDREEREKLLIVDDLEGQVLERADGSKVCVYYTYIGKKRYEQKVSLGLLNKNMVNNQYTPSRKAVEQIRKDGKAEY